jgi:hypothetical protein
LAKRFLREQIIEKPRETEILSGKGVSAAAVCRKIEVMDLAFYQFL